MPDLFKSDKKLEARIDRLYKKYTEDLGKVARDGGVVVKVDKSDYKDWYVAETARQKAIDAALTAKGDIKGHSHGAAREILRRSTLKTAAKAKKEMRSLKEAGEEITREMYEAKVRDTAGVMRGIKKEQLGIKEGESLPADDDISAEDWQAIRAAYHTAYPSKAPDKRARKARKR